MHCITKFMLICNCSRKCSNATCYHKTKHEYNMGKGCYTSYCNRYEDEKVCCIEVKLVS